MTAHPVLLQKKYARIIEHLSQQLQIDRSEALKLFYTSQTYPLVREGVSDLHCMSDQYLVEEIIAEQKQEAAPK